MASTGVDAVYRRKNREEVLVQQGDEGSSMDGPAARDRRRMGEEKKGGSGKDTGAVERFNAK